MYLGKKQDERLIQWMKKACESHGLRRGKRGYFALSTYLASHPKIPEKQYMLYSTVMLMILSSLFGPSGYDEHKVLAACPKADEEKLYKVLTSLIRDNTVVTILLLPTK